VIGRMYRTSVTMCRETIIKIERNARGHAAHPLLVGMGWVI